MQGHSSRPPAACSGCLCPAQREERPPGSWLLHQQNCKLPAAGGRKTGAKQQPLLPWCHLPGQAQAFLDWAPVSLLKATARDAGFSSENGMGLSVVVSLMKLCLGGKSRKENYIGHKVWWFSLQAQHTTEGRHRWITLSSRPAWSVL